MNQNREVQIAACMELIAGLERENKIQATLIKQQKAMIQTLEHQISELQNLLEEILKS